MGFHPQNMTRSQLLQDFVREQEDVVGEACDMTSTAGYDNDGSIGPELLDNGIGLGMAARDYDPKAIVFFAFGECEDGGQVCYYQFGKDEEDALRRLREMIEKLD
jgi:hypothetical protein